MLVSHAESFVFVHIYKCAGTSIKRALGQHCPWVLRTNRRRRWATRIRPLAPWIVPETVDLEKHAKAEEIRETLGRETFDSYFTFSFVRNPWDWNVSHYEYILDSSGHEDHETVRDLGSFEAFLDWLVADGAETQTDFLTGGDGEVIVDFVGKVERIEEDLAEICQRVGIDVPDLPRANRSQRRPYQEYYDDRTRDLMRKHFHEDVERFGYEF